MARYHGGAIAFGAGVAVLLSFGALLAPPFGALGVGAAAGTVAGALAGGGWRTGVRHGALAAGIGAAILLVFGVMIAVAVGVETVAIDPLTDWPPLSPLFDRWGGFAVLVLGAVFMVPIGAALGGIAGELRGSREFPDRLEREQPRR